MWTLKHGRDLPNSKRTKSALPFGNKVQTGGQVDIETTGLATDKMNILFQVICIRCSRLIDIPHKLSSVAARMVFVSESILEFRTSFGLSPAS